MNLKIISILTVLNLTLGFLLSGFHHHNEVDTVGGHEANEFVDDCNLCHFQNENLDIDDNNFSIETLFSISERQFQKNTSIIISRISLRISGRSPPNVA